MQIGIAKNIGASLTASLETADVCTSPEKGTCKHQLPPIFIGNHVHWLIHVRETFLALARDLFESLRP